MKYFRVLIFLVVLLLWPTNFNSVLADNQIPKAPFAQNVVVSPSVIQPGGTVEVTFEVIASSPLQSTASIVTFYGPGGVNYGKIFMQSSGTKLDAFWSAKIVIPESAPSGSYDLSISIPFDSNGLSGGFLQLAKILKVGNSQEQSPSPTPTPSTSSSNSISDISKNECLVFSANQGKDKILKIAEIYKLRADLKVSSSEIKSSDKVIKRFTELMQFDCQGITETFWQSIKVERNREIDKAIADFDAMYLRYIQMKGTTITCYKSGVTKIVSGKSPVCPKGYKKVSI